MQVVTTCRQLADVLALWRASAESWAFVPTMGALHEGHLTLARAAKAAYPRVVASVFVNPTQFDRAADLQRYPRQPQQDAALLASEGVDVLFLPSVEEVYPDGEGDARRLPNLAGIDMRYEGAARPGHFAGVVQVVRRLLDIVKPQALFLGQKDAQQVAVLSRAAHQEQWPVKIVTVPIVREPSGLAMSSRNGQLSSAGFAKAATINQCLDAAHEGWQNGQPPRQLEATARQTLSAAGLKPEYFDFVDPSSFEPLADTARVGKPALLVVVAWVDGVRLIDNRPLSSSVPAAALPLPTGVTRNG